MNHYKKQKCKIDLAILDTIAAHPDKEVANNLLLDISDYASGTVDTLDRKYSEVDKHLLKLSIALLQTDNPNLESAGFDIDENVIQFLEEDNELREKYNKLHQQNIKLKNMEVE